MQVARDGDRRGGEFVRLDVVTALEGDAGLGRYGKAAVEADGLRDVLLVAFGRVVAYISLCTASLKFDFVILTSLFPLSTSTRGYPS